MYCHNCGAKLEEGSIFCSECGTRQIDVSAPGEYDSVETEAGSRLEEDFGTDILEGTEESEGFDTYVSEEDEREPQGKGPLIIVILVIVLGIIFGVGGFFIYQKFSASDSKETEVVREEETVKEASDNPEKKETGETDADKDKAENQADDDNGDETKAKEEKSYIHEYTVIQGIRTWSDAKAYCEIQGGHLATVVSQEEFDQIVAKANETGCVVLWLGAERMGDGAFGWVTGEEFSFYAWASGEPNNDGGNENCLGMMKIQGTWNMYDMPNDVSSYYGSDKVGFVMEKDIEQYHE